MKKTYRSSLAAKALFCAVLLAGLTACSDDDDNDNLKPSDFDDTETLSVAGANFAYDSDGIWRDNAVNGFVKIDDFEFYHSAQDFGGFMYITGYTPSKSTDLGVYNPMYEHSYTCIAAGGPDGNGTPYLVANWDSSDASAEFNGKSTGISEEEGQPFQPQSVMVNNNTYAYYSMLNGDGFARKFAKGDWFKLIAHGVQADGSELTTEFYLANCTTDNAEAGIVKTWQKFDLTALGTVYGLYFTMASSDNGDYGMNTPAYFCIDRLIVKE